MTIWDQKHNSYALFEDDVGNLKQLVSSNEDPLTVITGLNLLNNGVGYELYLNDLDFICELPSVDVFSMLVEHELKLYEELNSKLSKINNNFLNQLQKANNGYIFQIHDSLQSLSELTYELVMYDFKKKYIEIETKYSFLKKIIKLHKLIHDLRALLKNIKGLPQTYCQDMESMTELLNTCKKILIDRCIVDTEQEFLKIIRKIDETNIQHSLFKKLRVAVKERNVENYRSVLSELEIQYEMRRLFKSMIKVI